MTRLTLYTRPGCHLCDDLKAVVTRVSQLMALELIEVDVTGDPALERAYGRDVPVLTQGTRILARHRTTDDELRRLIEHP
jgi:hypothetical protein